jgi:integrase
MVDFAQQNGLQYLNQFDIEQATAFRAKWTVHNLAASKRLDYLRGFFRFAHDRSWVSDNPAKKLKPPKTVSPPTMPFSRPEMDAILGACDRLKVKALVLLMRHSGLRIGDAVSLSADQIQDGKLLLRTAKTGTLVYVPLPPFVTTVLEAVKRKNGYFFWTGESKRSSVADTWRKQLAPVFTKAKIEGAHPHQFRDTFAVELLLAGVPLERVSILLGHSSTRITEKHYSLPWVRDRQAQLEADVRRTWGTDFSATGETKGTPGVHGKEARPN